MGEAAVVPERKSQAIAAFALAWSGSVGFLFLSIQPMMVGAWVDQGGLSLQQAGVAASANMLGNFIGAIVCLGLMHHMQVRTMIALSLALTAGAELLCALVSPDATTLFALRFIAGGGAGVLMAATAATAAAMREPDRVFAFIVFSQTLTGSLGLLFAPYVLAHFGLVGMFAILCGLTLSVFVFVPAFIEPPRKAGGVSPNVRVSTIAMLVLGALTINYIANNGVWAHLERIGDRAGLSHAGVGLALAAGQAASLWGSIAAAFLANRIRRRTGVTLGVIAIVAGTALLPFVSSVALLGLAVALFIGSLGLIVPFYMGVLAGEDPTGRLLVVGQIAIMAGLFIGPASAAAIATHASMNAMVWTACLIFALTLIPTFAALRGEPAPAARASRALEN